MKGERVYELVVHDILPQGSVIGAGHHLGVGRADATGRGAAGVKQQRRTWRDADIADRKEHRAGGLTVAVDAEAFARRVVLRDHGLEMRKRSWIGRAIAHAQGRYGSIGAGPPRREG